VPIYGHSAACDSQSGPMTHGEISPAWRAFFEEMTSLS
jgi:hypothetical protein